MSKNLIITGASGFIGSHVTKYFLDNTNWFLILIDSFRHKGTYSRLNEFINKYDTTRFKIYHHDLAVPIDKVLFNKITHCQALPIHYIINLASNSAVERSIFDPVECWRNNCELIVNMLEFARNLKRLELFIQISTDEVYGDAYLPRQNDPTFKGFKEWSTILPSNPYAASKAAQEALCIAYWRTYSTPIVLTNTMNNVGEWQDTEKFLPRIISLIDQGEKLAIYTDNEGEIGARVYLDAKDHAAALHHIINNYVSDSNNYGMKFIFKDRPPRFNICGNIELDNLEVAHMIGKLMGRGFNYDLVPAKSARPGYDKTYLLDPTLMGKFGWKPKHTIEQTFQRIIDHSLANPWWIKL